MALAVGMANCEVEFVFPTSQEVGHPSVELYRGVSDPRERRRSVSATGSGRSRG